MAGRRLAHAMPQRFTSERVDSIIAALEALHGEAIREELQMAEVLEQTARGHRSSARNLIHYLTLRQHDLRDLQASLLRIGLSSLGRCEAHTLAGIEAVLAALYRIAGRTAPARGPLPVDFDSGPGQLAAHAEALFGPPPGRRSTRMLVTLASEAARDPTVIRDLLGAGMDLARINCAHDDTDAWAAMLDHLARARAELGRQCRVLFDLAGPKLRTLVMPSGPRVLHLKPARDDRGVTTASAPVLLVAADQVALPGDDCPVLRLAGRNWGVLDRNRVLELRDTRNKRRCLRIVGAARNGWLAECAKPTWIEDGCELIETHSGERFRATGIASVELGVHVERGNRLWLTATGSPGIRDGALSIGCTLPAVLADVRMGERVYFDDGKFAGTIVEATPDAVAIDVAVAPPGGALLRSDKGINLPDSQLSVAGLTDADRLALDFVSRRADLVGLSFLRSSEDLIALQRELDSRGAAAAGIVVKIETRQAFDYLPSILLAGLRSPPFGVMLARGDLAVEVGFERMAEVQEEILWLCEAAHVPVVWATQVLDGLTRKGQASRAEVTDAAMAGRAECVMLNKGPHAAMALRFLADVLERMRQHQAKKRTLLRRLAVSAFERLRGNRPH